MSILSWLNEQERRGRICFSLSEIQERFPQKTRCVLISELSRLRKHHILSNVHSGFYVKIPVRYTLDGIVPPEYYIDQLMKHIGRPYYVSLLTAAQLYGAAHQSPHRFCVFTILPKMSLSEAKNPVVFWGYRQRIQQQLLIKSNSETAAVNFSCPELTAVDLIQYSQYIGGLSRAATVLAELIEKTDFSKVDPILYQYTSLASFQRLGYILEDVLDEKKQADILYSCLLKTNLNFRWTSLSKQKKTDNSMARSSRWRIIINTVIEVDDL